MQSLALVLYNRIAFFNSPNAKHKQILEIYSPALYSSHSYRCRKDLCKKKKKKSRKKEKKKKPQTNKKKKNTKER